MLKEKDLTVQSFEMWVPWRVALTSLTPLNLCFRLTCILLSDCSQAYYHINLEVAVRPWFFFECGPPSGFPEYQATWIIVNRTRRFGITHPQLPVRGTAPYLGDPSPVLPPYIREISCSIMVTAYHALRLQEQGMSNLQSYTFSSK